MTNGTRDRQHGFEDEPNLAALTKAHALLSTNPPLAHQELRRHASEGSTMSMVYLGNAYKTGIGVAVDILEAEKWFSRASSAGSVEGAFQLGMLYLQSKENDKAEGVFSMGTLEAFSPAVDRLACILLESEQPGKRERGRELLQRASAMGNIFAKRHLAGLMIRGALGPSRIFPGFLLLTRAVVEGMQIALRDPHSERIR